MTLIEKWKLRQDLKRAGQAHRLIELFYDSTRRKDFMLGIMIQMDFSVEELEELSNIFGREAHEKTRRGKKE